MRNEMKKELLAIWQFPQYLLGMLLFKLYKGEEIVVQPDFLKYPVKVKVVNIKRGISLGEFIVIRENYLQIDLLHELGHTKQSRILGPLYLLVIGLPSALAASVFEPYCKADGKYNRFYYEKYCEKWADRIAGVVREYYNPKT